MKIFYFILAGILSGIIGGMGMGGGTLLIPIITIFFAIEQKNAQAINLLVFMPMALSALIIHIKNKLVVFKLGIPIMCVGVIFSVIGSIIANKLGNGILRKIFAVFLLCIGIYQLFMTFISKRKKVNKNNFSRFKFKIYYK